MIRRAIARALKQQGMTTYQLAQRVKPNVTQSTVYRVVNANGETTVENLERILVALGLAVGPAPKRRTRPRR